MNIFLIIIAIFVLFIYGRKFVTNRVENFNRMREEQRKANRQSWKDLGFF